MLSLLEELCLGRTPVLSLVHCKQSFSTPFLYIHCAYFDLHLTICEPIILDYNIIKKVFTPCVSLTAPFIIYLFVYLFPHFIASDHQGLMRRFIQDDYTIKHLKLPININKKQQNNTYKKKHKNDLL